MMSVNRIVRFMTAAAILSISGFCAYAQDFAARVGNNPHIACGVYHPYHPSDMSDTPAPKGYKPFYISHFGRHGSRYHTTGKYFLAAVDALARADSAGTLTEKGKMLKHDIDILYKEHDGMNGELSPLGGREHKALARRMYARFPEVFSSRTRNKIECASSTVQRCIMSMTNFSGSLAACNPDLEFEFFTGQRYFAYLQKELPDHKEISSRVRHFSDSLRNAICRPERLLESIFVSPEAAAEAVRDPQQFAYSVYMAGVICPDLDFLGLDILRYLDHEELVRQTEVNSSRMYMQYGNSAECGRQTILAADDLLRDFIFKADAALLPTGKRAADLRFGHDTGILPLLGLIGLEGMSDRYPSDGSWEHWTTYDRIPMATNFQMIFYRSKKGEPLVKMLYNEGEVIIPALKTAVGPYYRWSELREYLLGRCQTNHK